MKKIVVFDFDGVMVNTFDITYKICCSIHAGLTREDFRNHHNGNVYQDPVVRFVEGDDEKFDIKYRENVCIENFFPIHDQVKQLNQEYELFVITSNLGKNVEYFLEKAGLKNYFSKIMGYEIHRSKIEKFRMIFLDNGMKPEECVFVTDTLGDLLEGEKIGVDSVAVTWGFHDEERLKKGNPNIIIHEYSNLVQGIKSLDEKRGI